MDIAGLRGEFTLYVIDRDAVSAKALAESLQAVGYVNSRFYPTLDSALAMAKSDPPHVVLVDFEGFEPGIETFLGDLKSISAEILPIVAVPGKQVLQALQLVGRSLAYDTIVKPFVSTLELIQKIDRAASRLYFQFESEQLREHYGAGGAPMPSAGLAGAQPQPQARALGMFELNTALAKFATIRDLEQTVQLMMETVSRACKDAPVIYFKYVASHASLLFAQSHHLPGEKFRGIGVDLKKEDPAQVLKNFESPGEIQPLRDLVKGVFKRDTFTAFTHFNDSEAAGIFVVLDKVDVSSDSSELLALRRIFELAYKRNLTLKEKHTLDITDPATGVFNRRHFTRLLEEEIVRSRRLSLPVTLIIVGIDGAAKWTDKIGTHQVDIVMKTIAQMLRKSARVNDIVARVGADQLACLMPHTAHMGGAVKAERFRRGIEGTKLAILENAGFGGATLSCGVSEYPSFCSDAESLFRSADEAMFEVRSATGNKVCLAKAPSGFKMDFKPHELPRATSAQRPAGG